MSNGKNVFGTHEATSQKAVVSHYPTQDRQPRMTDEAVKAQTLGPQRQPWARPSLGALMALHSDCGSCPLSGFLSAPPAAFHKFRASRDFQGHLHFTGDSWSGAWAPRHLPAGCPHPEHHSPSFFLCRLRPSLGVRHPGGPPGAPTL